MVCKYGTPIVTSKNHSPKYVFKCVDISCSTRSISLMKWDYDNDGIIDSEYSVCFPDTQLK